MLNKQAKQKGADVVIVTLKPTKILVQCVSRLRGAGFESGLTENRYYRTSSPKNSKDLGGSDASLNNSRIYTIFLYCGSTLILFYFFSNTGAVMCCSFL